MRPHVRPVFVATSIGALMATAWVWCLRAMIATLPIEHGPAQVVAVPDAEVVVAPAEAVVQFPVAALPPPFKVKWKEPVGSGRSGGEFGPRPNRRL